MTEKITSTTNNTNNNNNNENETRHEWVGKIIHRELFKKIKFDHTNKRYNYNPESALQNEVCKILWDFVIQTHHLISTRRPVLMIVNKKENLRMVDFVILADHRVKPKESEKKDVYLDLARELK